MTKRVVVVGGVAGGMSCAARLKRLEENVEITVFERGNDVSFANCGMPYFVGGVIGDRHQMLVQTPATLRARFDLDVRIRHAVTRIDRAKKQVEVRNLESDKTSMHPYDVLVLAPGASPIRPPIPGSDGAKVFVLNNLADMDAIAAATKAGKRACVVGAGFIGLELVENLKHRGLEVTLIEMMNQVLPPLDWEMTQMLLDELRLNGVEVLLEETVTAIEDVSDGKSVTLKSGKTVSCDFVCLCAGVRPNSELAKDAGLALGVRGHIRVDAHLRTSDSAIYALGDAVELLDAERGEWNAIPLAGPANRQGRIAADNIAGRTTEYRGTQGASIVKVFQLAAASTGLNERRLKQVSLPYRRIFVHPTQHPRYYPGAQPVALKLLFSPEGQLYGAQVVGSEGVDAIINVLATAISSDLTVEDLEHLELAYSPQWGGAKSPVNIAGFVAGNLLRGDVATFEPEDATDSMQVLDVCTEAEAEGGMLPGAQLIPVDELRTRINELPKDKPIAVYCAVGLRGYVACRFLKQKGYDARNLNGGYRTWSWFQPENRILHKQDNASGVACSISTPKGISAVKLDCSGMQCPGPLVQIHKAMAELAEKDELEVMATDPGFVADVQAWCKRTGNHLVATNACQGTYSARIVKGTVQEDAAKPKASSTEPAQNTLVCFSDDLDRVMATFVIANGATAMGNKVTIFFTFWGLNVLRKQNPPSVTKGFLDKMFGMMMPKGPDRLKLSKLNMGGLGTAMMKYVMGQKKVMSLPELIQSARNEGVRLVACSMSMDVMGIKAEELMEGVEIGGVGLYLGQASESNVNLFI